MVVSNSSCLIILEKLGKTDLLKKLYSKITIPIASAMRFSGQGGSLNGLKPLK